MKKILDFKSPKEHYSADACVVWCFDSRFTPVLKEFTESQNLFNYDLVKLAGGVKSLASPAFESERSFALKQIHASINLHRTKRMILANHADCGAYGGSEEFNCDPVKERKMHFRELAAAKRFLKDKLLPGVKIETVFIDFEGVWKI